MKKLCLILVLFLLSNNSFCQINISQSQDDCFEIAKVNKEYFIELNGILYKDKDKISICNNHIPLNIKLLYNLPGDSLHLDTIRGTSWDWNACDCNPLTPSNTQVLIDSTHFENYISNFKVRFVDVYSNDIVTLECDIEILNKVEISTKKTKKLPNLHAFDENVFENYPFYYKDIPWKFLTWTSSDSIVLKGRKLIASQTILSAPTNNLSLKGKGKNVGLEYIGTSPKDSSLIQVCNNMDTLIMVDIVDTTKFIPIHFWTIRESDDDSINYCLTDNSLKSDCITPIVSDTFNCILPGTDGTFDLYLSSNQHWLDPVNDSIFAINTSYMKVMAGKDKKCQSSIYNSNSLIEDAPDFDFNQMISNSNQILNKGGIQLYPINHGIVNANFDIVEDDNIASFTEAVQVKIALGIDFQYYNQQVVLIFTDLTDPISQGNSSTRRGLSSLGGKFTILDGNRMVERTLAHELGHSLWSLRHPDELTSNNNPILDGLIDLVDNDPENLMTSGTNGNSKAFNSLLRRYVWKRMH